MCGDLCNFFFFLLSVKLYKYLRGKSLGLMNPCNFWPFPLPVFCVAVHGAVHNTSGQWVNQWAYSRKASSNSWCASSSPSSSWGGLFRRLQRGFCSNGVLSYYGHFCLPFLTVCVYIAVNKSCYEMNHWIYLALNEQNLPFGGRKEPDI